MRLPRDTDIMRHVASRVEILPFLRSTATQHLERLQLLHDDVRDLTSRVIGLRGQYTFIEANVQHLASRIDALQMLLPAYDTPPDERQQNVTNAAGERQHIVDPIT